MADPSARLDTWLEDHPDLCRRVIVPAELKWEVRDKLDQANINERTLVSRSRRFEPLARALLHA